METHFFENIPKTVKKCVDFVAEVNASHCVKSICQTLIPELKTKIREELKKYGPQNRMVSKART